MMVAILVPILTTAIIAAVIVSYLYFRSRDKQLLLEKGLTPEEMKEYLKRKTSPVLLLKIGIVVISFGVGLSLGLALEEFTDYDFWVPMGIFIFTGLGFVGAYYAGKKEDNQNGNF